MLGEEYDLDRKIASAATPRGTGAVRSAFELIKLASPEATFWVSDPSWSNHPITLEYLDFPNHKHRYFEPATGALDFEGMMAGLTTAQTGDVLLLHGYCYTPTGLNLAPDQWRSVVSLVQDCILTRMINITNQGLGDGLEEDEFGAPLGQGCAKGPDRRKLLQEIRN